ncbi:MAG: hypothetical protein BWY17_01632 [Deltaproteobacteria bacterium ADurb.Bin207]|mgnify:FL=1|nr:MAG: hypothetical protein BWY17_01632 [Deltaproteobacteria bacterium ADurb.Bin207]
MSPRMKRVSYFSWIVSASLAVACGPSASTTSPATPSTPTATEEQPPTVVYSKFTDPLFLALGEEKNVFGRRTLARLWVVASNFDPPGPAQQARLQEAQRAVDEAEHAVGAQTDVCEAGVSVAVVRAIETKKQVEQRYLSTVEQGGEACPQARSLDAQVHFLRDEIEALQELAQPCPPQMFDDPPEESR